MSPNEKTLVRIRMYRVGLGDCFLLTFFTAHEPVHIMIDCGYIGAAIHKVDIDDVVANIAAETNSHLHLLVLTHEHQDHVRGFLVHDDVFNQFTVDRVWVAWTEDPKDDKAKEILKYQQDLLSALHLASNVLLENKAIRDDEREALGEIALGVRNLLDFSSADPIAGGPLAADFAETVHDAMSYASKLAGGLPTFWSPGQLIEPDWLPGVRIYVLGPPRDKKALLKEGDHDSPELYGITQRLSLDLRRALPFYTSDQPLDDYLKVLGDMDTNTRQEFEAALPFDPRFRIESDGNVAPEPRFQPYFAEDAAWRRIDYDWLTTVDALALQRDNMINNTSLVLAIELIQDGRVLLFPGDAQLGNWKSWQNVEFQVKENGDERTVTATDLLRHTVVYKVAHHASHNGTINENGLEAMQRDDLVALISLDQEAAKNKKWTMPEQALYDRLLEKAHGRVLRSDIGWSPDKPVNLSAAEWQKVQEDKAFVIEDLYIDYLLK